ncbi:hypothetical protein LTR62_000133 [Meristemomyces frigidus]|uniref:Pentatricopeptide repeat domain-containing protein n=1 Tax=Meristemomyces frigidus TaxID=1508187 RepID=A0AAN7TQB5_9PEZI|nr:hypothetical protein LTR62_000133 [Meristemomyces frigidus]
MTSVLARLGQLEARSAIHTLWRPKKRKREEWICWQCHHQPGKVQLRGYTDDAARIGDYVYGGRSDRLQDEGGGSTVQNAQIPAGEARMERVHDEVSTPTQSSKRMVGRANTRKFFDAQRVSAGAWNERSQADAMAPDSPHEAFQDDLWEQFEEASVESGSQTEALPANLYNKVENIEYNPQRSLQSGRDPELLLIDYAALLPEALASDQVDMTARCLFAAVRADDLEFIRAMSVETFSRILEVMRPSASIEKLASAHVELSEAIAKHFGIISMREVAHEYSQLLSEIIGLRRSVGGCLTFDDYKLLLQGARDLGYSRLARSLWKRMQLDGHIPDVDCYNSYMAGYVFNEAHNAAGRHRVRITPFNILARVKATLGMPFKSYRVSVGGLKVQIMSIFREMLGNGVVANEQSFRLVIGAAAREGDLATVKSVLRKVWAIDVDKLMNGSDETPLASKHIPLESPIRPTQSLLFALAHAFGINNDIPTALRLVDFVARSYNLTIDDTAWTCLFEWTFVMSTPLPAVKGGRPIDRPGQLPKQSVLNLWSTMTNPPYSVKPTMGMYNHLLKSLMYRDMPGSIIHHMDECQALEVEHRRQRSESWETLHRAVKLSKHGPVADPSVEPALREWEYQSLLCRRNTFWLKRWLRLLLASTRSPASIDFSGDLTARQIPRVLHDFRHWAPRQVRYETATGMVEFSIRTDNEIGPSLAVRAKYRMREQRLLARVPRYIGSGWARPQKPLVSKRLRGREREFGLEADADDATAKAGTSPSSAVDRDVEDDETKAVQAKMHEAMKQALDVRT